MPIQLRARELLAKKSRLEGRKLTYRVIKAETGINMNTIAAVMNDDWSLIGRETIERLLDYFDCEASDLIVRVREEQ
jgi:putative transcriptional regulator